MKTLTTMVVALAMASAGCGDNYEAQEPGAMVSAPPVETPPRPFTREDSLRCVTWPICDTGIVRLANQQRVPVLADYCRATFGIPLSCGPCVDTRTAECKPFVGPCMAPNSPQIAPDFCGNMASPPNPPPFGIGWTLCTGAVQDGPDAELVCGKTGQ